MPKLYPLLWLALASQGMGLTSKKLGPEVNASEEETKQHEFQTGSYQLGPGYSDNKNHKYSEGYSGISHFDQYSFHEGTFENNRDDISESTTGDMQQSSTIGVIPGTEKLFVQEAINDGTVSNDKQEGHERLSEFGNSNVKFGEHETSDGHSIGDRASYAFFAIGDSLADRPNTQVNGDQSIAGDGKIQHYHRFGVGDDVIGGRDYSYSKPAEFGELNFDNHHDKSVNKFIDENNGGISESISDKEHVFSNVLLQYHQYQEPQVHEVTKIIPVHKTIKIPEPHEVQKPLNIPVPFKVLEPYHIKIPVPIPVEKVVHVPVEKIVKYSVIKPVPVKVEKEIRVPVLKPFPVPVPVYKLKLVIHSEDSQHEK